TAYPLNADGTLGAAIGTATTASDGKYSLTLTSTPTGAVVLVASGGTYVSESDGTTVTKTSDLLAIVPSVSAGATNIVITPLSADFSDGVFDGKKAGVPVTLGTGTLAFTAGTSDFLSCVAGYAASGKAVLDAGLTVADLSATVGIVRTAVTASAATPKSTGLS